MAEWLKAHAWKACERATVPEVRILSLPPENKIITLQSYYFVFLVGKVEGSSPRFEWSKAQLCDIHILSLP